MQDSKETCQSDTGPENEPHYIHLKNSVSFLNFIRTHQTFLRFDAMADLQRIDLIMKDFLEILRTIIFKHNYDMNDRLPNNQRNERQIKYKTKE